MAGETDHDGDIVFTPPDAGHWMLETAHHGLRPLSYLVRDAYVRAFESGTRAMLERYGLPIDRIETALVHGCFYLSPRGVGEGSTPKPPPPAVVMKLVARLHPEMRRRTRTAQRAWEERRWRSEVDRWFDHDRDRMLDANLALQGIDPVSLDDGELAEHLSACLRHFEDGMRRNLDTHGGDLAPTGDLLAHAERWGIGPGAIADLLVGASPATVETAELLRPVAAALARSDDSPETIDDIRALGSDVDDAVTVWLDRHAWRLSTTDDVDRPTLAELPALQLRALRSAVELDVTLSDPTEWRERVPPSERALFDALLVEARHGHRQRDDIRGLCWNWPGGLVRRAMLEAGRRLAAGGLLLESRHAVECTPAELDGLLRTGSGPTAATLAARSTERDRIEASPPPRTLGPPDEPPPLDALPAALARASAALMAALGVDETPTGIEPLHGIGIGHSTYTGRACIARDAAEAMESLEPGDVLIAPFTGPSFNSLLPIVGALVVEEGGPLCHAAIVAREFGVPALVGTRDATTIPAGSTVELDPVAGTIRVV